MRRYLLLLVLLCFAVLFFGAGRFLVIDNPQKSDTIVVLAGTSIDERYYRALDLLRHGYASHLFLDVNAKSSYYGHPLTEYATRFLEETAGPQRSQVSVCNIEDDSTRTETIYIDRCLRSVGAKKALLITSDFHTRRALSIMRKLLPRYEWSVGASQDPFTFGTNWWSNREWAKTAFGEWQRTIWWNLIDRWTSKPIQ